MSFRASFRSCFKLLQSSLFKLNLFEGGVQDEATIGNQRRSTRLYLFLLFTSMFIIGLYNVVTLYVRTVVVKSPSFNQYLALAEQASLQCSCVKLAVKYQDFMEVEPFYDAVCQSELLSVSFIDQLYTLYAQSRYEYNRIDFRRIAMFQFKTLGALCRLAKETIESHLQQFLHSDFIQSQLISEELLRMQMNASLVEFIDATPKSFLRTLTFVQNITAQSLLMTGASVTSVQPRQQIIRNEYDVSFYDGITYIFTDGSSCTCSSSTSTTCLGLATLQDEVVPGFQTGCYMLSALLKSTLEIFHNQTFIDFLTKSSGRFQKLNFSNPKKSISELLNDMFIRYWRNETSFAQYFHQCAPSSCQYTVIQRHEFVYIITLMIGLFGGLSSMLRMIVPVLLHTIIPKVARLRRKQRISPTPPVNHHSATISVGARMRNSFQFVREKLTGLNLFRTVPPSTEQHVLRRERLITRLYLAAILASLITIVVTASIDGQTVYFIVDSPSREDFMQLAEKYSTTLSCPCSQMATDQERFSYIEPQYHEICSSQYVSPDWINVKFEEFSSAILFTRDIRYHWRIHFQLLSTLCQMSRLTVQDALRSYNRTKFVTTQTLHAQSFKDQMDLIVAQFERTVHASFQRSLGLIKTNSEINQFINPINSNFRYWFPRTYGLYLSSPKYDWQKKLDCIASTGGEDSSCYCDPTALDPCYQNIVIYGENETRSPIPGMFQTWFPLQSLLVSTLECFYNNTCLSQIEQVLDSDTLTSNLTVLESSSSTTLPMSELANALFIQSWHNQSSFESYFDQCRPLTCQYAIYTRLSVVYIVTKILGLIGGINVVLRLFLPISVKAIQTFFNGIVEMKRDGSGRNAARMSRTRHLYHHLHALVRFGKQYLLELNLFPALSPAARDAKFIERGRRTTRVYLILLIVSLIILTLYGLFREETMISTVKSPSVSKYRELFPQYPLTLRCPCSRSTIKYDTIIPQIELRYHEVCSSIFVSTQWLESVQSRERYATMYSARQDYRDLLRLHFQALLQLCALSQSILNDSLTNFRKNDFITSEIISPGEFDFRTTAILEQFETSAFQQFTETVKLIQLTNDGNQLATAFSSNWKFSTRYSIWTVNATGDQTIDVRTDPATHGPNSCSCGLQSNCSALTSLTYGVFTSAWDQVIPGFRFGCLLFDAFLQSSLVCLYNKTCLGLMQVHMPNNKPVKVSPLTASPLSAPNTTIETLLNKAFVLEWLYRMSFDAYFEECAPRTCQYSFSVQYNVIYTITVLLAVFGGLANGLHFILYYAEAILFRIIHGRKKTNAKISTIDHEHENIETTLNPAVFVIEPNNTIVPIPNESQRTYRNAVITISFLLLASAGLTTAIIVLLKNQRNQEASLSVLVQTTITNSISTVETITDVPNSCYMTFKYQAEGYPTGKTPVSLVTGDFNSDSMIDLAVASSYSDTLSVLLGNGDGTFRTAQVLFTGNGSRPGEIKTADLNNDTLLDLVVALTGTAKIGIFYGVPTQHLFRSPIYELSCYNYSHPPVVIELGDLDNDGTIDLVVGRNFNDSLDEKRLSIFLNCGDGYQFDEAYTDLLWTASNILAIVIDGFDEVGRNQLSVCFDDNYVRTYYATEYGGSIGYAYDSAYRMYAYPSLMINGRFGDDERKDLALVSVQSDVLSVVSSIVNWVTYQQIYLTENHPTAMARINFNNDTIDDLAILTCNGTLTVFLGQSIGSFDTNYLSFPTNISANTKCAHALNAVDLNQDQKDDVIFLDPAMNRVRVMMATSCHREL